jgi:PTH1 family peptidyl-tRNA hydrolase
VSDEAVHLSFIFFLFPSMATLKRLIIGLGNPGPMYEGTRHNIGFAIIDAIAETRGMILQSTLERNFFARFKKKTVTVAPGAHAFAEGRFKGTPFGLLKPLTYMNRSGEAVAPIMRRNEMKPSAILVVVDDIHLPVGMIRLRPGGSAGGHNGLIDITERINSDNFPRMRIGIGGNFERGQQAQYVLSRFEAEEVDLIEEVIKTACAAALTFVSDGISTAMNRYNRNLKN